MKSQHVKVQLEGDSEKLHQVVPANAAQKIAENARRELITTLLLALMILLVAGVIGFGLYRSGSAKNQSLPPNATIPEGRPGNGLPLTTHDAQKTEDISGKGSRRGLKSK